MNIKWNSKEYKDNFSFVPEYGMDVTKLIESKKGAKVLDLGCGNGTITKRLSEEGYNVTGMDASNDMLKLAKENYPELHFVKGDATDFKLGEFDCIFSNAVFHWINDQDALMKSLNHNLKMNGELVFEFGGYHCAEAVHSTLEKLFPKYGFVYKRTFYFPTISEYSRRLEENGFLVKFAILFDRPTPQKNGLEGWIRMFDKEPFEGVPEEIKTKIIQDACEVLKERLYQDGVWIVDYTRIRMRAVKVGNV